MSIEISIDSLELTLECEICGATLNANMHRKKRDLIVVEPCEDCLREAEEKGERTAVE